MRILVACEFSGIVRDAFIRHGHDAWSCDLMPTESTRSGNHHTGDAVRAAYSGWVYGYDIHTGKDGDHYKKWDMLIAHPPCTHLAVSGARWFKDKQTEQQQAIDFFMALVNAPTDKICIENPVSIMSTRYRKPDQIIQPWMFGHGETKTTCLWLKNLQPLKPTAIVDGRDNRIHREPPSPERWKNRSRFYTGIAQAMAEQWGVIT